MKNKFDRFNNYDIEIETSELNDIEKQKMINQAKSYSKRKPRFAKIAGLVAVIVLMISLISPTVRAEVADLANNIKASLFGFISVSENADDYIVSVHEKMDAKESELILEDIALDDENIYFSIVSPNIENNDYRYIRNLGYTIVNGEEIKINNGEIYAIEIENVEDNLLSIFYYYELDKPIQFSKDLELELHFSSKQIAHNLTLDEFSHKVEIPKDKLPKKTKTILENFQIPNSDESVVEYIKINPIMQRAKINSKYPYEIYKADLKLIGTDKNGKSIVFNQMKSFNHETFLNFSSDESKITIEELLTEPNEITFNLYRMGLEGSNSKNQVGDSFTVTIPNE